MASQHADWIQGQLRRAIGQHLYIHHATATSGNYSAVVLVGHSFGGMAIAAVANRRAIAAVS